MNADAVSFYRNDGVQRIAPAYEKAPAEEAVLMFCKHCLRYSMGWCPSWHKVRSPYRNLIIWLARIQMFPLRV